MPSKTTRQVRLPDCLVAAGLVALATAGCYSPYGYQGQYPGGYYGQPPYQTAPVYPGTPGNGGIYVPGGTTPGASPTPLNPPSTYDNGSGINWQDPKNNAAPFDPNPGSDRGKVPDPVDDLKNASPGASRPTLTPTSGIVEEPQNNPFDTPANSGGVPSGGSGQPAQLPVEDDPFFEMPQQKSSSTAGKTVIQTVSYEEPSASKLNPYGRDLKNANPSWLRGVIDYDTKLKTWSILYSANPDPRDPNGGVLTLANHPNLAKCRIGEIVLVEGAIDASQADARGKPVYVLDNVTPLSAQ